MKNYLTEKDGQLDFLNTYLKRVDNSINIEQILQDNTDGVINGNLLEFKLNINNVNSVLSQSIKYLSSMRIKGKLIPKNMLLVSLNQDIVYVYDSNLFLKEIETVYVGSASKNNLDFNNLGEGYSLDLTTEIGQEKLVTLLKENQFTKINIDENCIVGWAERYYRENENAPKSAFIGDTEGKVKITGEIRKPTHFKEFIYPYKGKNNVRFQY